MARKRNIIVVGNGLFGSIAATLARAEGHEVTVVADARPYRASPASGCVLAPSWLSSLDKTQIAESMGVLSDLYKVYDMEFQTNLLKTFKAKRVATGDVLVKPDVEGTVTEVGDGWVKGANGGKLQGHVLVAAGIWCQELLKNMPAVRGLYGASLHVSATLEQPRLHVYAPYRQAVAFQMSKGKVWMGDGTALIEKTWMKEETLRISTTRGRFGNTTGLKTPPKGWDTKVIVGARPYVEGRKAGYFQQVSPRTWVSTGGAKNGTVLAAWQALQFVKELR